MHRPCLRQASTASAAQLHTNTINLTKLAEHLYALIIIQNYFLVFSIHLVHKYTITPVSMFPLIGTELVVMGMTLAFTQYSTQPRVVFQGFYVTGIWPRRLFLYQIRLETSAPHMGGKQIPFTARLKTDLKTAAAP